MQDREAKTLRRFAGIVVSKIDPARQDLRFAVKRRKCLHLCCNAVLTIKECRVEFQPAAIDRRSIIIRRLGQ